MKILKPGGWREFREMLLVYAARDSLRRDQLIFRGQSNGSAIWPLNCSIDRHLNARSNKTRDDAVTELLERFLEQAARIGHIDLPSGVALELFARHRGLPTPLLDWTQSPYVASYFAYAGATAGQESPVSIWLLDRSAYDFGDGAAIELIDDLNMLKRVIRAIHQKGLFIRVDDVSEPIEKVLDAALTRFDLPVGDRLLAMADLDEMGINATALFQDLDHAAQAALATWSGAQS